MSDSSSAGGESEITVVNVQTAGTVRHNKLCPLDYLLIGTSTAIFLAGAVLLTQSRAEISKRRISRKLLLAILLMILAFFLGPIFNYLFANNPNAPLFS